MVINRIHNAKGASPQNIKCVGNLLCQRKYADLSKIHNSGLNKKLDNLFVGHTPDIVRFVYYLF